MKKAWFVLLVCLISYGCIKPIKVAPAASEILKFSLNGNTVIAEYITPAGRISFEKFNYSVVDKNEKLMFTFLPLEYDLERKIIYGSAFVTATGAKYRKKFVIAKGETAGNELKVTFPSGTKFFIEKKVPVPPFNYVDMLKIRLPYSFEEIQWLE